MHEWIKVPRKMNGMVSLGDVESFQKRIREGEDMTRKFEKIPVIEEKDGVLVLNACACEANEDWLRARRLLIAAEQGDEKAREELERMDSSIQYRLVETPDDE